MTAVREIYGRFGCQLRNNRRCFRAEKLCPGAMGLYLFLVLDARGELPEVDGFVPEEVALGAWNGSADYRLAQIEALCAVDLVERIENGFRVVKYDEHNDTRERVSKNKKKAKRRKNAWMEKNASGTRSEDVPNAFGSISISSSLSPSGSESRGGVQGEPPDWFKVDAVATVEMAGLKVDEIGPRWLEYVASRQRKSWPMNHGDAVGWLTSVLRSEARDKREGRGKRGAEITKQPTDPNAPWMKLPEVG